MSGDRTCCAAASAWFSCCCLNRCSSCWACLLRQADWIRVAASCGLCPCPLSAASCSFTTCHHSFVGLFIHVFMHAVLYSYIQTPAPTPYPSILHALSLPAVHSSSLLMHVVPGPSPVLPKWSKQPSSCKQSWYYVHAGPNIPLHTPNRLNIQLPASCIVSGSCTCITNVEVSLCVKRPLCM